MKKIIAITLLILCYCCMQSQAQNRKISGSVTDTAKVAISRANILVISESDTIRTSSDSEGNFSISKFSAKHFTLRISSMGYKDFSATYSFEEKERHKRLEPLELDMSSQTLKEVVIKGKPNPVRFMQDTVEYDALAYQVNEGDNVADLIKQFPGMEIDDEYNVKTMGKDMVKLRVNGKDFFTSNIKEFIGRLPAGIVSKIQVIDDFGDQANFTGLKVGEPTKMLNIVTKPGMDKGTFGNASVNTGTNDMIGSHANANIWNNTKQSSANLSGNTANNGAGNSRSMGLGISHNDKLGKNSSGGFGYRFNDNKSAFANEQAIESINPNGGNFINNNKSEGKNGGSNHNLNGNINYNNKKIFLNAGISAGYSHSGNENNALSNQFGLIRQDLKNSNTSKTRTPNISGNISISKRLKNKRNSFSANGSFNLSNNKSQQNINTYTRFYKKDTEILTGDSLLNRDIFNNSSTQGFNFGFNYSLGLKKLKDTLASQSLNISYGASINQTFSEASTYVYDNKTYQVHFVDSLSSLFNGFTFNQNIGGNYNFNSRKTRFNFGINLQPTLLRNRDKQLDQTLHNNTLNYSPSINFSRTLTKSKTISLNYQGSNRNPSLQQLQPLRNVQNLQNVFVGNPNLKSAFSHNLNSNFNYSHIKTGISIQSGLQFSTVQREIVSNVIILPDTLDSQKQITRYENINGNYQTSGNYSLHLPIKKNKISIRYSGSVGFSNQAIIFNNEKAFGKGLNFSQRIGGNLNLKKHSVNANLNYSLSNNSNSNYLSSMYGTSINPGVGIGQINAPAFFRTSSFGMSLGGNVRLKDLRFTGNFNYNNSINDTGTEEPARNISNVNMNFSASWTVKKSLNINANASKTLNYGFALANTNPFLINASLSKNFLKNQALSLSINANDLLGEGNNLTRSVFGNTIIDNRNRQQTRVFSLNLSYNLSSFGGRHFRVDPD